LQLLTYIIVYRLRCFDSIVNYCLKASSPGNLSPAKKESIAPPDLKPINEFITASFDDSLLFKLSPIISSLHKSVKKSIEDTFNHVRTIDKELTISKTEYFIRCLYLNAKKDQTSKKKNKLTIDIVDRIKDQL